jgi:hypothetical protein
MSEDTKKAEDTELSEQDLNKVAGGTGEVVVERITLTNADNPGSEAGR